MRSRARRAPTASAPTARGRAWPARPSARCARRERVRSASREHRPPPDGTETWHDAPAMPEATIAATTAPERLNRKTTSIAQLLARRVQETPDREAYRYPVGDHWRSMTWRQSGERVKAIAAGLLSLGLGRE